MLLHYCIAPKTLGLSSRYPHDKFTRLHGLSYKGKKWLRHFMKNLRFFVNLCPSGDGLSYKGKKWLRHFMKNLRFFVNLCPSGDGLSYKGKKSWPNSQLPAFYSSPYCNPVLQFRLRSHLAKITTHKTGTAIGSSTERTVPTIPITTKKITTPKTINSHPGRR